MLAGLNAGILVSGLLEGFYLRGVGLGAYLQMHQPRDALFRRMMPPLLLALLAFALVLADVLMTVRRMVPLNL